MAHPDCVSVRPATELDIAGIADVQVASWKTTYRGIVPGAHLDGLSVERSIDRWQRVFQNEAQTGWFTLVAQAGERIVGLRARVQSAV